MQEAIFLRVIRVCITVPWQNMGLQYITVLRIITVPMFVNPQKSIPFFIFLRISYNCMSWGFLGMLKHRSGKDVVSNRWESIKFVLGLHLSCFQRYSGSKFWSHNFQLPTMIGVESNVSISSHPYQYPILNSCRYLKSETYL